MANAQQQAQEGQEVASAWWWFQDFVVDYGPAEETEFNNLAATLNGSGQ